MDRGAIRTRTADEEAELRTLSAAIEQSQTGLSVLASRGMAESVPGQKLRAQHGVLAARQVALEHFPEFQPSRPDLAVAGDDGDADDAQQAAWRERQRLLEFHVDGARAPQAAPPSGGDGGAAAEAWLLAELDAEGDESEAAKGAASAAELQASVAALEQRCAAAEAGASKAAAAEEDLARQQAELRVSMSDCMAAGEMDRVRRALAQQGELEEQLAAATARRERLVATSAAMARQLVGAKAMLGAAAVQSGGCERCARAPADELCVPCQLAKLKAQQQAMIEARRGPAQAVAVPASAEPEPEPEPVAAEAEAEAPRERSPSSVRLSDGEMLARGVKDVNEWLSARGHGDKAPDTVVALREIGLPPEEWLLELSDMEEDGSLEGFVESINRHKDASPSGAKESTAGGGGGGGEYEGATVMAPTQQLGTLGALPAAAGGHPTGDALICSGGSKRSSSSGLLSTLQRMSSTQTQEVKPPRNFWNDNIDLVASYPALIDSAIKSALRLGVPQDYRRVVWCDFTSNFDHFSTVLRLSLVYFDDRLRLSGAEAECRGDYDGYYEAACVLCFQIKGLPVGGLNNLIVDGKYPLFGGDLVQYTWMRDQDIQAVQRSV